MMKIIDVFFIFIISYMTVSGTLECVVKLWSKVNEWTENYSLILIIILYFFIVLLLWVYKNIFNAPNKFLVIMSCVYCAIPSFVWYCFSLEMGVQVAASICLIILIPCFSAFRLVKNPNIPNISDKMFVGIFTVIAIIFAIELWKQMTVIDNERYIFNGVGKPCVIQLDNKKLALVSEEKTIKIKVNFEKQDGFFVDEVKKEPKCIILD